MNPTASIRSLRAAVRRLEAAVGKGPRYCPFCRYVQGLSRADPKGLELTPKEVLKARCEFCNSEYSLYLSMSGEEPEVLRMFFSYTLEDRYTDLKAHAVTLWWHLKPERAEKGERRAAPKGKVRRDPLARAGAKLLDEHHWLMARREKKLKAKYGDPFPELYQLIEVVRKRERRKVYALGLAPLEREETEHLVRAELEKVIWGEIRAETASAIKKLGEEIDELVRTAQAEEERRRAESGPTTRELLNMRRAQRGLPPLSS